MISIKHALPMSIAITARERALIIEALSLAASRRESQSRGRPQGRNAARYDKAAAEMRLLRRRLSCNQQ